MLSYLPRLLMRSAIWVIGVVTKGIWCDDFFGQLHAEGGWGHFWAGSLGAVIVSLSSSSVISWWNDPGSIKRNEDLCSLCTGLKAARVFWVICLIKKKKKLVASLQKVFCQQSPRMWGTGGTELLLFDLEEQTHSADSEAKWQSSLTFFLMDLLKICLKMNFN